MKKTIICLLLATLTCSVFAQSDEYSQTKLRIVDSYFTYLSSTMQNNQNELVEIKKEIPSIVLDIRYATNNNFMQQVMYNQARAFARRPVVEALKKVQTILRARGLGLKIYDGYRPYAVTVDFYKKASDKNFVANPAKGSKHNRGCAIDCTLIDLKTGKELEMPTPYDSFSKAAAAGYPAVSAVARTNRDLLIFIMRKNQMNVLSNEWWHYDFVSWRNFDLMDIPFEKL
ncbi:D-alanyl-D-alanine dipeptidase [Pedobacter sp. UYP30]|uniref:M15 family metallopeptidase n=1 Tax=Pedobacter sp. UYP30 TaxID=1756400 RepID=UPI0033976149